MRRFSIIVAVSAAVLVAAPLMTQAAIHEKIAAACRAGGEEVVPPGQVSGNGMAFVRALRATGIISSTDTSVPGQVTIHFDLSRPSSKYKSAGFDLTIPNGAGPGVDLILSPLPMLDPDFAAHARCKNLNP